MLWRYVPMADPSVDEWHSRDLDSRVSERCVSINFPKEISERMHDIFNSGRWPLSMTGSAAKRPSMS